MQSLIVKAPGRINLIGEHIDYNEGLVLPAAIQKAAIVSISKRFDDQFHLTAVDIPDELVIESYADLCIQEKQWANYIIGVIVQFLKKIKFPTGFNIAITSDIPMGAGLSSSAAIECAVAFGINELFELGIDRMELAFMAQKAEHEFVGVQCGIMDSFASLLGKKNHVILLDCKTLTYQYYPLDLQAHSILLLDTGIQHALASSEYNNRRKECENGVALIQLKYPAVTSLRNATIEMLNECVPQLTNKKVYKRCKYVIEEIERTQNACMDLKANNLEAFGQKMFMTHDGLSTLYEVSCPELDFLVNEVRNKPSVLGARMMGGGFGGCTLNIIQTNQVEKVIKEVKIAYESTTGKALNYYDVSLEDGAGIV